MWPFPIMTNHVWKQPWNFFPSWWNIWIQTWCKTWNKINELFLTLFLVTVAASSVFHYFINDREIKKITSVRSQQKQYYTILSMLVNKSVHAHSRIPLYFLVTQICERPHLVIISDSSQNLASIIIEINSKKHMLWHVFLDIFWPRFLPKTVPENVQNITYLSAEMAKKCCWNESARNRLWSIIDRLYPTNGRPWKSELSPITTPITNHNILSFVWSLYIADILGRYFGALTLYRHFSCMLFLWYVSFIFIAGLKYFPFCSATTRFLEASWAETYSKKLIGPQISLC